MDQMDMHRKQKRNIVTKLAKTMVFP